MSLRARRPHRDKDKIHNVDARSSKFSDVNGCQNNDSPTIVNGNIIIMINFPSRPKGVIIIIFSFCFFLETRVLGCCDEQTHLQS
ncbi:hypothetical protein PILCRDRAFT_15800 [Piloderma croceum F 1598]|uniref:Uncharacterized protein n=1 Tax=Piloderma croceum (strain F 1598) TaxID=765440 RepID=A0A0C3B679_PILCF|nr:hypothetical protein PILCRDRAFT_15800 [Piloderma croceum F 1598]